MHHGHHEAACECVAIDQRDCRHGISEQAVEERIEAVLPETRRVVRVLEVKTIGVEFVDARGREDDSRGVAVLDDVEGQDESLAEGLGITGQFIL